VKSVVKISDGFFPRFLVSPQNRFEVGSQEAKNSNFHSLALAATGSVAQIRIGSVSSVKSVVKKDSGIADGR